MTATAEESGLLETEEEIVIVEEEQPTTEEEQPEEEQQPTEEEPTEEEQQPTEETEPTIEELQKELEAELEQDGEIIQLEELPEEIIEDIEPEEAGEEILPVGAVSITGGADMDHAAEIALQTEYVSKFSNDKETMWYKFTTGSKPTYYDVTVKNLKVEGNVVAYLYSDIGERINRQVLWRGDQITFRLRSETSKSYYINVENDTASGNFSISVKELEDPDGELKSDATPVAEGEVYTGSICCEEDTDWFSFVPKYDGIYNFDFMALTCDDLSYDIYSQIDEVLCTGKVYKGRSISARASLKKGETYYIKLHCGYNLVFPDCNVGNYRFSFNNYFPFNDVDIISGHWKYEAVKYVSDHEIMNGISGTLNFNPDGDLNRAMFATILYRMAGSPGVSFDSSVFTDVTRRGEYYSEAVIWAYNQGIISGFGDGSYGVNVNITREQIAKMLYGYANSRGYNMNTGGSLNGFTDLNQVNGWAMDYVRWAVGAGMITGKPNGDGTYRIDPKGNATRGECAKMIQMFMKQYTE